MSIPVVTPVILCGGSGTRLWPLSRQHAPKQFAPLFDGVSLFQETALRAQGATGNTPVVVCNEEHRFVVEQQLEAVGIKAAGIICEPVPRNTAPAVAAAAACLSREDPRALALVLPSDHLVPDVGEFAGEVAQAARAAMEGHLVTFGITPTSPHTGYGYIRRGPAFFLLPRVAVAEEFVEKPDLSTAREYIADQKWLWNSGMFMLRCDVLLDEMAVFEPEVAARACAAVGPMEEDGVVYLDPVEFGAAPSVSLDYAVMERTKVGAVLPTPLRWSDVGAWSSLWEIADKDDQGNARSGDVVAADASNCYLHSDGPLVAALGVHDVTVVATKDAVLVADIAQSEQVKTLVGQLQALSRGEADQAHVTRRPWGTYESVDTGDLHQVKHISVLPGQKLSLQRHRHRSEHWVVVKGTAQVVRGTTEGILLEENESIFIPRGCLHRLENPGEDVLHLIEVQVGTYLGEDDIERLDDVYGRC